jgi:mannopine transport system permease protein
MDNPFLRHFGRLLGLVVVLSILTFLLIPTLIVIPMSFSSTSYLTFPPQGLSLKWYAEYFSDPAWQSATWFSLKIATLTTLASVLIGTPAAIALVRSQFPGREFLNALVLAPLVVPQIITGVAIYLEFAPLGLTGTTLGFVLAHTALSVPFVVVVVSAGVMKIDPQLEVAALSLGSSRFRALLEVTIPLAAPAIAGGAIFAFLASFDEAVVSFFISGVETKTVTRKLFEDIDYNLSPVIAAVSSIFIAVTILLTAFGKLGIRTSPKQGA